MSESSPQQAAERIRSAIASGHRQRAYRIYQHATGNSLWASREAIKSSAGAIVDRLAEPWVPVESGPRLPHALQARLGWQMVAYLLALVAYALLVVFLWLFSSWRVLHAISLFGLAAALLFAVAIPFALRFEFSTHRDENTPIKAFDRRFMEWIRQLLILGFALPACMMAAILLTEAIMRVAPERLAWGIHKLAIIGFIYLTFEVLSTLRRRDLIGPY